MDSIPQMIGGLFWPPDATTQLAVGLLVGFALLAFASVHLPLAARLLRIAKLQRAVQGSFDQESSNQVQRKEIANAFADSPLAFHWSEFVRRWQNAIAADPVQDASVPELSRAPVRLADVFTEHPIIQAGARRSLLPTLPAILLSAGLLGAFASLVLALPGIGSSLDASSSGDVTRAEQITTLMTHLGMSLRIGLWGLLLSLAAAIAGRILEGRSESLSETLDSWVQLAYGSISTGELTTRAAHEQREAIDRLQEEVAELSRHVSSRPRPLIRSTAAIPGAGPATSPEISPKALEALGAELSTKLERKLEEQMAALRDTLGTAERPPSETSGNIGRIEAGFVALQSAIAGLANQAPANAPPAPIDTKALEGSVASLGDRLEVVAATLRSELSAQRRETQEAFERSLLRDSPSTGALERNEARSILEEEEGGLSTSAASTGEATPQVEEPPEAEEAETIPYMEAPELTPRSESSYSAGLDQTSGVPLTRPATMGGSTLSGLLRATHHSGPSSVLPDQDEEPSPEDATAPEADAAVDHDADTEEIDVGHLQNPTPRRKLFGRRR